MKTEILSINGEKQGTIDLPNIFENEIRPDLIRRAYEAEQSLLKPSYGPFQFAGKLTSAPKQLKHARSGYKAHYGQGMSRVPRKMLTRRGTRFFWVGAFAPGTRGGRAAHPPKSFKNFEKEINKKENKKAFYSALSAVAKHSLIIENKFEDLKKTKEIKNVLKKIVQDRKVLIVTSKKLSTKNLNANFAQAKNLSISDLAPNANPRNLVLWTESAIKEIK